MKKNNNQNIPIYIQQDAKLRSLFYLETVVRVSGGTTTHHQERKISFCQNVCYRLENAKHFSRNS
jgi:hypothetical protein